jgi:hypothetical protein
MEKNMVEKRNDKRSLIELAASFGIDDDPRAGRNAKINNMSMGGFCLTSDCKLRTGQQIQLAVDLDTADDVVITVKVVWLKRDEVYGKYSIGVQIVEKEGPGFDRFVEFYESVCA